MRGFSASAAGSASMIGFGKSRHLGGLPGHQRVRLHVEHEVVGGPLRPQRRDRALGERVVGGVHLHRRELTRVVAKPVLARRHTARIEHAALGDGRIRPRRGADTDLARAVRLDEERTADLIGRRRVDRTRGALRGGGEAAVVVVVEVGRDLVGLGGARHGQRVLQRIIPAMRAASAHSARLADGHPHRVRLLRGVEREPAALRDQPRHEALPFRHALHLDRDRVHRLLDPLEAFARFGRRRRRPIAVRDARFQISRDIESAIGESTNRMKQMMIGVGIRRSRSARWPREVLRRPRLGDERAACGDASCSPISSSSDSSRTMRWSSTASRDSRPALFAPSARRSCSTSCRRRLVALSSWSLISVRRERRLARSCRDIAPPGSDPSGDDVGSGRARRGRRRGRGSLQEG